MTGKQSFPKYYWIVYNANCCRNCSTILNFSIVGPADSRTAVTLIRLPYLLGIKLISLDCWHACYQNILLNFFFKFVLSATHQYRQDALSNIFADQSCYVINNSSYLSEGY